MCREPGLLTCVLTRALSGRWRAGRERQRSRGCTIARCDPDADTVCAVNVVPEGRWSVTILRGLYYRPARVKLTMPKPALPGRLQPVSGGLAVHIGEIN